MRNIQFILLILFSTFSFSKNLPSLVLLPIDLGIQNSNEAGLYEAAITEGLRNRYSVTFGTDVESLLEKEYSKLDCSVELCMQAVATGFNAEFIADASVAKTENGYALKLAIYSVVVNELVDIETRTCRNCDSISVIRELKLLGQGEVGNSQKSRERVARTEKPKSNKYCKQGDLGGIPVWVDQNFRYQEQGYKFGFAHIPFSKKVNYKSQFEQALLLARQDLAGSIQTEIQSHTQLTTSVTGSGKNERVATQSNTEVNSKTALKLPDLNVHNTWLDGKDCGLYLQVSISNETLELVLARQQIDSYLLMAEDDALATDNRIIAISEAIKLLDRHEFSKLQSSESSKYLKHQFQLIQKNLSNRKVRQQNLVAIVNRSEFETGMSTDAIISAIKNNVDGSFESKEVCRSQFECIDLARKTEAKWVTIVTIELNTQKQSSFWLGDFTAEVTTWRLDDQKKVVSTGPLDSRIMNRYQHKLSMDQAVEKWMMAHGSQLQKLMSDI